MINVSSVYKKAASSNVRQISAKIVIGSAVYENDDIISIDISSGSGEGGMSIGSTISARMVAVIKCITPPSMTGYQIDVYAKINLSDYQQLGRYYITNVTKDNNYTIIEAYDKMYWLDKSCNFNGTKSGSVAALTWPATHQQMIDYIASIRGFNAAVVCAAFAPVTSRPIYNSEATSAENKYYTYREIVSFIAASNGCNAQFNNVGSLVFTRPGTAVETIVDTDCESCSIEPSDDGFTVVGIRMVTGAGIDFYIDAEKGDCDEDTAGVLSCDNPLATVEIAEYVWSKLGGFKYYTAQITRRGRGWLMPNDVINVKYNNTTYPALIGEINYILSADGGFNESITSTAENAAESSNRAMESAHSADEVKNITNNVNVDKAIILTQEDAQTLVHNFVQTGYIAGQQIGYNSEPGDIIVQGYVVQHYQSSTVRYQSVSLKNVYYVASSDYSDRVIHDNVVFYPYVSISTQKYGYLYIKNDVGWGYYTSSSAVVLNKYREFVGLNMYWTSIQPPSDDYPFGYAEVVLHGVYKNQAGEMDTHGFYNHLSLPFASTAEYNAAVGLTKTPLELLKLDDYPYIVPESKIVIDNTVSKSSTNPISNAAVANALEGKSDVGHIHSYDDLTGLPKINGIPLTGDRSAAEIGAAEVQHTHNTADISDFPDIPTKVSELQNDIGYLTSETDPTVPAWAKAETKPEYTAAEVGAAEKLHSHSISDITDMPTALPANGGNADTVDGKHASAFAEAEHTHTATEVGAAPKSHTHTKSQITDFPTAMKNPSALTVQMNGTTAAEYDGGTAKTVNITPSGIGAATAADIAAAVNNIQVGGRNLLYHSRFDNKYADYWAYSTSVTYSFDGGYTTMTKSETTTRQFTTQASNKNLNLLPENGCSYTLSCEVMKAEGFNVGYGTKVTVRYNYTDGTVKDFDINIPSDITEDVWRKCSYAFTYSSGKTINYTQFIVALGAEACGIKIKNVKFEKGNKATDWSSAPEDEERRITALEARIAELEAALVSGGE